MILRKIELTDSDKVINRSGENNNVLYELWKRIR